MWKSRRRSTPGCQTLLLCTALGLALLTGGSPELLAQKPVPSKPARNTETETRIDIELLTGVEGVGLAAQEWSQIFEELGVELRVRRGVAEEESEITERMIGTTLREVKVVGYLEKNGSLTFPGQRFTRDKLPQLREWLKELRTYGAQGTPEGKPLWGLTKDQFEPVYQALGAKQEKEIQGLEFTKAVVALEIPIEWPLKFTVASEKKLAARTGARDVHQALAGMAKGTAFAIMLNEQGLGFRPRRTPAGTIELAVFDLAETRDVWPVGWPLSKKGPAVAPKMYKLVKIELEDEPLTDILNALPAFLDIPLLIDLHGLREQMIDLETAKVTLPLRQTTWNQALRSVAFQAKLRHELYQDEAGKPFLWITPLKSPARTNEE